VVEDVALELRRLNLGSDLGAFLGRGEVTDLQIRDRRVDAGELLVVAVRLLGLRHGPSSTHTTRCRFSLEHAGTTTN
jgi:hypothetical protein